MKQLVKIYSASWCQPCKSAKRLLTERGLKYEEIDIEERGWNREDLFDLTGGRTVPQIVIDGQPVGGYDELLQLDLDLVMMNQKESGKQYVILIQIFLVKNPL